MVKLSELRVGDIITLDDGFSCLDAGNYKVLWDNGFYVPCNHGKHYLDGQENEQGILVGIVAHAH